VSVVDGVTLAIAVLGAVLGVINAWQAHDRDRVKLRVAPRVAYTFTALGDAHHVGIEVINRSAFPLTISQVGFLLDSGERCALITPILFDGGGFPRRLEARTAFTAFFKPGWERGAHFTVATRAYAETTAGDVALSSRRAVRRLRAALSR
jgi:hypothetical protein